VAAAGARPFAAFGAIGPRLRPISG